MDTIGPHIRTIPVHCAPCKAPCPTCGKLGRRKATHNRRVRTIAYKQVVFLDVTYGEYRARCGCCTTFRTTPPGVEPRALYDNKVRQAVLDRILEDGMSVERVIAAMGRDFHLDLSDGFVYDCLDWQARGAELAGPPRPARPAGPAARPGGPPPPGPGPFQRHALRRRVAPGPNDVAAGDRPVERP